MSTELRACSACGAVASPEAQFCAQCGRSLDADAAERRVYGVLTPAPMLVVTGIFLLGGLLALLARSLGAAVIMLALSVVAFVFLLGAAKRHPDSPVGRRVTGAVANLRGWAAFGRESTLAWSGATRDVVKLKKERRSLQRVREAAIRTLGDAAYREDDDAVTELRTRIHELDDRLAELERQETATLDRVRRHVADEHAAARPTQQYSVDELTKEKD